jgi:methylmalonyl-CoA/ethylmalonyl-CoA epimerase
MNQDSSADTVPQVPEAVAIDHVGIAVADLDAAIAFYRSTLGLVETHREINDQQHVTEVILGTAAQPGPGNAPTTVLQLLSPTSQESAIAKFLQRSGPGMHHLAYQVPDLDATTTALSRGGIRMLYEAGRAGTRGSLINFLHPKDAGGVLIELVQPARIAR